MKLVLLLLVAVTLGAQTPRIAVGGIMHESNTFSADLTELADFSRWRGDCFPCGLRTDRWTHHRGRYRGAHRC